MSESAGYLDDKNTAQKVLFTIYHISEAVDRKADSLYVSETDILQRMINDLNGWAYIYIYEEDRILWSTKDLNTDEIYIPLKEKTSDVIILPREMVPKEYFYDIEDSNNQPYRQCKHRA